MPTPLPKLTANQKIGRFRALRTMLTNYPKLTANQKIGQFRELYLAPNLKPGQLPHPTSPTMDNQGSPLTRVQKKWEAHIKAKHYIQRWTQVDSKIPPVREKPGGNSRKASTKPEIDTSVLLEGVWVHSESRLPILTKEAMCRIILGRWINKKSTLSKTDFILNIMREFHKPRQKDIRIVIEFVHDEVPALEKVVVGRKRKRPLVTDPRHTAPSLAALTTSIAIHAGNLVDESAHRAVTSLAQRISSVNSQQERLLRCDRVLALLTSVQSSIKSHPKSRYARFGPQLISILQNGSAARTSLNHEDADFLALNLKELDDWMRNGTGNKVILVRDRPWAVSRPERSAKSVLSDAYALEKDLQIDLQDFSVPWSSSGPSVRKSPIQEAMKRLAEPTNMPINALNLLCYDQNLTPPPIANQCDTLLKATASASFKAARLVQGKEPDAGKEGVDVEYKFAADIRSCISFQILGQAGAFSPWHVDNLGVITWLTLEPDDTYATAEVIEFDKSESQKFKHFYWKADDESVLKLWAVVLPSKEERAEAEEEFVKYGADWIPQARWVKIIALTRFDTLVMPPGTIHAPITVTDCLFRGGMAMQERFLKDSINNWNSCARNPHVTNEGRPRQAPAIIDYLEKVVLESPAKCGYDPQEFDVENFKKTCQWIAGGGVGAVRCVCKTGCTADRCSCHKSGQRCGSACHEGKWKNKSCSNPCGWQGNCS